MIRMEVEKKVVSLLEQEPELKHVGERIKNEMKQQIEQAILIEEEIKEAEPVIIEKPKEMPIMDIYISVSHADQEKPPNAE
jgi:hypothetical protein